MQEDPRQSGYRNLLDERRTSTRMRKDPHTDFAAIWQADDEPLLVEVYDESLGGMCLVLEDIAAYAIDSEIEILYKSTILRGIERHIKSRPDGTHLVGFECRPLD